MDLAWTCVADRNADRQASAMQEQVVGVGGRQDARHIRATGGLPRANQLMGAIELLSGEAMLPPLWVQGRTPSLSA